MREENSKIEKQCPLCGMWWDVMHMCLGYSSLPNREEKPFCCPKCDGMTTLSKRNPYWYPSDMLCPTCKGSGVVWK